MICVITICRGGFMLFLSNMGLQPLEFSDCITDSPYFREKVHKHEKELDRTSKAIKTLTAECSNLLQAAKSLSRAQRSFASHLIQFKFECIGSEQTEDELVIENSLNQFGQLITAVEEQRDRILNHANDTIISPLENFRKERLGAAKEGKKKFDKQTAKFCQLLDKYLALKSKSGESNLKEADVSLDFERRAFYESSMEYVLVLQEVQERKKFEFVEILLLFVSEWLTFYHDGYEKSKDFKSYMNDLQVKLQKCRENFDVTKGEAELLKRKMLEKTPEPYNASKQSTREGYLFMLEKKSLGLPISGTSWSKVYCSYDKTNKILTMIPYNQTTSKGISTDTVVLKSCVRRAGDSIDRRFCFDLNVQDRQTPITLQALSEEDMQLWLQAMDGKEPVFSLPNTRRESESQLDDIGFEFIKKCIQVIEQRGLEEEGLYRLVGVSSKVAKLINAGLDRKKNDKIDLADNEQWETKTITSALKNYFRTLPEPLMTFKLHPLFITAAKKENRDERVEQIQKLVYQLPRPNYEMLKILIAHLQKVSENNKVNLMTVCNLGVCFGPTLMRPEEETMAAIMDIKWCNIVVEVLVTHYYQIFATADSIPEEEEPELPVSYTIRPAIHYSPGGIPIPPKPNTSPQPPRGHARGLSDPVTTAYDNALYGPVMLRNKDGGGVAACAMTNSISDGVDGVRLRDGLVGVDLYKGVPPNIPEEEETFKQRRAKIKPATGLYTQYSPSDYTSSRSSSSESLTSKTSSSQAPQSSPLLNSRLSEEADTVGNLPPTGNVRQAIQRFSVFTGAPGMTPPSTEKTARSSDGSIDSSTSQQVTKKGRKVVTLYPCIADNETELSFEANQEISDVHVSKEPGWLEGSLNGKRGLIPANYVVFCD